MPIAIVEKEWDESKHPRGEGGRFGEGGGVINVSQSEFQANPTQGFRFAADPHAIAWFSQGKDFESGTINLTQSFFEHNAAERAEIIQHEQAHRLESEVPSSVKSSLLDHKELMEMHGRNINEKLAHWMAAGKPMPESVKASLSPKVLSWAESHGFNTQTMAHESEKPRETSQETYSHGAYVMDADGNWVKKGGEGSGIVGHTTARPESEGRPEGVAEYTPSDKVRIAQTAYVSANYAEQKIADEQERIVSKAVGLPRTPDNAEFDLKTPVIGVEIKTMIKQTNDKITMSKSALAKKIDMIQASGPSFRAFTVVADKRGGATRYYYREGVGSFRLGTMKQTTLPQLKAILRPN